MEFVYLFAVVFALTNMRSLFSTEIKKAFKHSRNCYLACFRYPAVQVMFHETYKNGKVSIFCKCSCIFFPARDVARVQITFKSFLLLRVAAQEWCKCISSYKQLVLNHNFVWASTRSNSLFYLCSSPRNELLYCTRMF